MRQEKISSERCLTFLSGELITENLVVNVKRLESNKLRFVVEMENGK